MSEIPVHSRPRRLVDWINPTGARKIHSLIDKVYQRELGDGLGDGQGQPGQWRSGRAESGRICRATRSAVGSIAPGTEGRCLPASTGAAGADPEGGKARRVSQVGNPDDLRPGMPASVAQSAGTDLRVGV